MKNIMYCEIEKMEVNKMYHCSDIPYCDVCIEAEKRRAAQHKKIDKLLEKEKSKASAQKKKADAKSKAGKKRAPEKTKRPHVAKNLKNSLALLYDYLKRSENYKLYCDFRRLNPAALPPELAYLGHAYSLYKNIYAVSFDEWLNYVLSEIDRNKKGKPDDITAEHPAYSAYLPFMPVVNFGDTFALQVNEYVLNYQALKKVPPTLEILRDHFANQLTVPHSITLTVNFNNDLTLAEIKKQVAAEIKQKLNTFKNNYPAADLEQAIKNGYAVSWRTPYIPSTKIKRELTDYIKVWDNKEKYIKKLRVSKEYDNTFAATFYKKRRKAKKIIENVECGIFPGDYADKIK